MINNSREDYKVSKRGTAGHGENVLKVFEKITKTK